MSYVLYNMAGVHDDDGVEPELVRADDSRLKVRAYNQGGHDWTEVDLLELLAWCEAHKAELERAQPKGEK